MSEDLVTKHFTVLKYCLHRCNVFLDKERMSRVLLIHNINVEDYLIFDCKVRCFKKDLNLLNVGKPVFEQGIPKCGNNLTLLYTSLFDHCMKSTKKSV